MVSITDSVVRDILLAGIYDVDIRRDVLSDTSMATKSINDIISIIESKESARDAVTALSPRAPAPEAAAASSYSKQSTWRRTKSPEAAERYPPNQWSARPYPPTWRHPASPPLHVRRVLHGLHTIPVREMERHATHLLQGVSPAEQTPEEALPQAQRQ